MTDHLTTQATQQLTVDATSPSDPTVKMTPPRTASHDPHRAAPTTPRDPERYEIIAEHGRGGLGRVSRAHDLDLGRDVAIKELLISIEWRPGEPRPRT